MGSKFNQRKNLYAVSPYCCYCGILTILLDRYPNNKGFDLNVATIEHIYSRLDPLRKKTYHLPINKRLKIACLKCNQQKNKEDNLKFKSNPARSNKLDLISTWRGTAGCRGSFWKQVSMDIDWFDRF